VSADMNTANYPAHQMRRRPRPGLPRLSEYPHYQRHQRRNVI